MLSRNTSEALISCDRLVRIYAADGIEQQALQGLDLRVADGELTAVVGASGSGKSTLLNILAGLDRPTAGAARVAGHDLAAMRHQERLGYRRRVVGFIWQQTSRNLLPYLTAEQNVMLPMGFGRVRRRDRRPRAADLLGVLGVAHCAARRPAQLSGGEQQRVSPPHWPTSPGCCSPTSPPVSWTARRLRTCSARCAGPTPSSPLPCCWSPMTRPSPGRSAGSSRSGTGGPARRRCTRRPPMSMARSPGARSSTPCWTGPAGSSCRAS